MREISGEDPDPHGSSSWETSWSGDPGGKNSAVHLKCLYLRFFFYKWINSLECH